MKNKINLKMLQKVLKRASYEIWGWRGERDQIRWGFTSFDIGFCFEGSEKLFDVVSIIVIIFVFLFEGGEYCFVFYLFQFYYCYFIYVEFIL